MIYIDGDSCCCKEIVIRLAQEYKQKVSIYIDTAHIYASAYAAVITVDKGLDSVDYAILKHIKKNDILVSSDYALCAMALTKGAHPILTSDNIVTIDNIDSLLINRYINKKARDIIMHTKGPKKRTKIDDKNFEVSLRSLLEEKIWGFYIG